MKKTLLYACTAIMFVGLGCAKEDPTQASQNLSGTAGVTADKAVNAVPIKFQEISSFQGERWNPCSEEFMDFAGTIHTEIRGVLSDHKITFVLHINVSNVRATGRTSGTEYVTTSTFNYTNTFNFNTQFVYQQRATTNFIAQGKGSNFSIENDWHLTVNANGETTFFFTTGGEIFNCQ